MDAAKIRLSQKELGQVIDADWILTKNAIMEKTIALLALLQTKQQAYINSFPQQLPVEIKRSTPKISKGEKYQGLPYLLLDYPRYFVQQNILAVRTMFWWGNFFSVTLHLSGVCKSAAETKLIDAYTLLGEKGFYCCINEKQWEHDFSPGNYIAVAEIGETGFKQLISEKDFVKLACRIPLRQWEDAGVFLLDSFKEIIGILAGQLPRR
ncbi:MAG: hypothetical protein ABIR30_04815 [Chitinophagaceae bacterium]